MSTQSKSAITVSVCMLTYNHAEYVAAAIRSVVEQQVEFAIELVIGDDASSDGTRGICEEYQRRYPALIRYVFNETNVGMNRNFLATYARCRGQYVALLEGDDSWIDKRKLHKQVRLLEETPDGVLCYSNAKVNDIQNPSSSVYFTSQNRPPPRLNRYQALRHCVIPTCTVLFRNELRSFPQWFVDTRASAYFLFYLLSKRGDLIYLDDTLALYNHHYQGMSRRTNLDAMLYNDSILLYGLVEEFDGDPEIRDIVLEKNMEAVNSLFHRRAFALAVRLFWHAGLRNLLRNERHRATVAKLFLKTHLLFFLSRNETKSVY